MKQKKLFFIGVVFIMILSAFTTYSVISEEYLISAPSDPSFEDRLKYHDDEIYSLNNHYVTSSHSLIPDDYIGLMDDFENVILSQKEYMEDNNITIEQIRENPSILPKNFKITDAQYEKFKNIVNTTLPISSPELKESINSLDEYVDLAREVKYSKFEIFKDATGIDLLETNFTTGDEKGLQSKEAIRKLKDLMKNKITIKDNQFSIYPNPLKESSRVSFHNNLSGEVTFTLLDIQGKSIQHKVKNIEGKGLITLEFNDLVNNKLPTGIYIMKIKTTEGLVMSNKFIIN
jgi:hypothetical protein